MKCLTALPTWNQFTFHLGNLCENKDFSKMDSTESQYVPVMEYFEDLAQYAIFYAK